MTELKPPAWTDSRHALPPSDEEVLVWQSDTFNIVCFQPAEHGAWFNNEMWFTLGEIGQFFWQPLPHPPEQP